MKYFVKSAHLQQKIIVQNIFCFGVSSALQRLDILLTKEYNC